LIQQIYRITPAIGAKVIKERKMPEKSTKKAVQTETMLHIGTKPN